MKAFFSSPWFHRVGGALAAGVVYILCGKFPEYAGPIAAIASAIAPDIFGGKKADPS